jgi:hypothetical protein
MGDKQIDDVKRTLQQRKDFCDGRSEAHTQTARSYSRRNGQLAVLAIILSALLGIPVVGAATVNTSTVVAATPQQQESKQGQAGKEEVAKGTQRVPLYIQWLAGILALGSAIVSGIQRAFNSAELANKHDEAAAQYNDVSSDVDRALLEQTRSAVLKQLEKIDEHLDQILKTAPRIHNKFQHLVTVKERTPTSG